MKKSIFASLLFLGLMASSAIVLAKPDSIEYKGKTYYIVDGNDKAMDTGKEVCVSVGKTCVGYTAQNLDVCLKAHPDAKKVTDANGSKAGFYCNGSPQGGVCGNEKDTCHICPNCNLNMDCDTQIGDLYRETFVECSGGDDEIAVSSEESNGVISKIFDAPGRWWNKFWDVVARAFDFFREKLGRLTMMQIKHVTIQVQGLSGTVSADIPEDSYVCEFYQKNKKMVTCGALAAADSFCVEAMQSRFATAALCQDDGIIVCSNPCTTSPEQIKPNRCAFDADRPRGNQAPPLDFCNQTIKIDPNVSTPGTKKAGQECAHGGECATSFCLGQPSDSGIKYFCSCKQTVLDYACGK